MKRGNFFAALPEATGDESAEAIIATPCVTIERIISRGHRSPEGFWYDQDHDEWVLLLRGKAGLAVEGIDETVILEAGDYVLLPAHLRHRVEWTAEDEDSIWLAVHY